MDGACEEVKEKSGGGRGHFTVTSLLASFSLNPHFILRATLNWTPNPNVGRRRYLLRCSYVPLHWNLWAGKTVKMPSSELKYCHFIPGLDFRLSARTAEKRGRNRLKTRGEEQWNVEGTRSRQTGGGLRKEGEDPSYIFYRHLYA